jgi:hypothetical protein
MDNSSRNIVKFIIAITGAALLIMGARFYAESQKVAPPPEVVEKPAVPEVVAEEPVDDAVLNPDDDAQNPANQVIEEDAELIMGEPSMNLEQGGTQTYAPPAQSEPLPEPQPEQ